MHNIPRYINWRVGIVAIENMCTKYLNQLTGYWICDDKHLRMTYLGDNVYINNLSQNMFLHQIKHTRYRLTYLETLAWEYWNKALCEWWMSVVKLSHEFRSTCIGIFIIQNPHKCRLVIDVHWVNPFTLGQQPGSKKGLQKRPHILSKLYISGTEGSFYMIQKTQQNPLAINVHWVGSFILGRISPQKGRNSSIFPNIGHKIG